MFVDLKLDQRAVRALERDLQQVERIMRQAEAAALTRAARRVRTLATRDVAARKAVPQREVRRRVRIRRAKPRWLESRVWLGMRPIKLVFLGKPRQTRRGAGAGRHQRAGAFLVTMPSGHRGVFKRRGKARLPIDEQVVELMPQPDAVLRRHALAVQRNELPDLVRKEFRFRYQRARR